jgi:hypothetical protein
VHYDYDAATYFPSDMKMAPESASGSQIDLGDAARTVELIEAFLARYPPALIRTNLHHIYLLGRLVVYGRRFGGTCSEDSIYLANEGLGAGYSSGFLTATLHHEFSSMLYLNYEPPNEQWNNVNGKGWQYAGYGSAFDVLERVDLHERSEQLHSQGFLTKYAQTSLEEDFNTFAESLFTEPLWLISAASQHEKIWLKLKLITAFYRKLGVQFQVTDDLKGKRYLEARELPQTSDLLDSPRPGSEGVVELPLDVFGPPQERSLTITIKDSSTYRISGPATVTVTGPATVTVTGPGSGPLSVIAQP